MCNKCLYKRHDIRVKVGHMIDVISNMWPIYFSIKYSEFETPALKKL